MLKFFIKAVTRILSTDFFAKLLFGIDCSKSTAGYQIGFSTILMKKALKKLVKSNDKVLDIGTGALAIHGIWIRKNIGADVVATEISDKYIESAKKVAKYNNINIKILKSDLFKGIKGRFDWVIFNPPFRNRKDSNGYRIVERLLKDAPENTRLMIVVNAFYANQKRIEETIKNNDYAIKDTITKFLNPSKVYIVEKQA
ncbi:methyltransferase [Candidatus Woesearchaeota archaeon]|nr:methyltransferase [Candidatus Woesearchaeota archaeon]